jgi:hypothetical protein
MERHSGRLAGKSDLGPPKLFHGCERTQRLHSLLPFFGRKHFLNRELGKLLSRHGA